MNEICLGLNNIYFKLYACVNSVNKQMPERERIQTTGTQHVVSGGAVIFLKSRFYTKYYSYAKTKAHIKTRGIITVFTQPCLDSPRGFDADQKIAADLLHICYM